MKLIVNKNFDHCHRIFSSLILNIGRWVKIKRERQRENRKLIRYRVIESSVERNGFIIC